MPSFVEDVTNEAGRAGGSIPGVSDAAEWFKKMGKAPAGYDVQQSAFKDPRIAQERARYAQEIASARGRQFEGANAAQVPAWMRNQQQSLISQLQGAASGQSQSIGELALQQQTQRGLSEAAALQASQRGGGAALGARQLGMRQAEIQQGAAGQAAMARLQEQQMARQALGDVLSGARGQDIQEAGFQQQANMANLQARMEQQRQIDEMAKFYEGMGFSRDQAQFQAQQDLQKLLVDQSLGRGGLEMQGRGQQAGLIGQVVGGAGAVGAALASDERQKTQKQPGGSAAYEFLESLKPSTFQYKNPLMPGAAPGNQLGVMAQDVARGPGAQMVQNTPNGLALNVPQGLGATLAAQGNLHERLKMLEERQGQSPSGAREAGTYQTQRASTIEMLKELLGIGATSSRFVGGGGGVQSGSNP